MSVKRVTVNMTSEEYNFLHELARKEEITFTDALRQAINSEKFFVEQEERGNKVLVEDGDALKLVVRK